ncbi:MULTISPECIES: hypothetical protein [Streptomyces]|uniref:hypothetical protein n=1 Tax=Streptomyces TaxID=1883 RepID=UPI00240D8351|nr:MULTISPECIES: hypothetical protein [Streptomyces]WFB83760.1 hypothetical protein MMU79_10795 [Streptomyces olivaceus]WGK50622.1 hypothetical protein M6G09_36210 [Streptomyces sp. B146]
MNAPELLPLATGTATLVGAGVAGVVAHLTTRRTTLTTWRAKTAEWQYKALTSFYDVALGAREALSHRRGDSRRLIEAWRRLELTGPEGLVKWAKPLYAAALELTHCNDLRGWRDLVEEIRVQQSHLAYEAEREGIPDIQAMEAESAATSLYQLLHDVHAGARKDWAEVRKAADAYDDAERRRLGLDTDEDPGGMWRSINALLRSLGDPHEAHQKRAAAQLQFDEAGGKFTFEMREWLSGHNPKTAS